MEHALTITSGSAGRSFRHALKSGLLCMVLTLFTAGTAAAHAHLESSTPGADDTIASAPDQLTLTFSEAIEKAFSSVEPTTADGDASCQTTDTS